MHISPYARFLAQAYAQFVEASNFCNRKKGKISKRVGKEERMARFCSGQRKTGRASFVLRRCGSACCFPAKGRCLQERIRGPEVVGSTAPPITARPSLSTLPHVAVWKMSVCARCQVFRLSRVHTRLGKRGENNSFPR